MKKLTDLDIGECGIISEFLCSDEAISEAERHTEKAPTNKSTSTSTDLSAISSSLIRLMEMGLVRGTPIKVCHHAPFGKDPVAVEVRGSIIGIARSEAFKIIIAASDITGSSE